MGDTENDNEVVQKTPKQLEKEALKAAKLKKLQEKLDKKSSAPVAAPKEKPEKKAKETIIYEATSAPGEKKDISGPMPDSYSPLYVEAQWYSWWEKEGFFKPEYGMKDGNVSPKGQFVMVIPPPNVTGSLHLGHALTNSIQDAVTRWHRMNGRTALWVPGCDHAGIATQVVVEKKLWREEKLSRHDLGREKFIEKIWQWREEKGDRIYHQLRKLGSSFDWDRVSFTMDPKLCRSVTEAFIKLYEKGLVYRNSRLVNWSTSLKSAISDIEVDKVEIPGRTFLAIPGYTDKVEFGVLISFAYEVEGTGEKIVVATTRIETMLGDTGVAVHPKDPRYTHLQGKFVKHPFAADRKIPIVCDDFVDMNFGTGAVKITPAHDPNDYDVGKRHNLPFITIFSDEGIIIGDYGKFTGMKRFDARKAVLAELKELGMYIETVDNPMVVPMCSRSKDVVEPLIKPQWYVKCDDMAANATEVVKSGQLKLIPDTYNKIWYHWMEGTRDWCVSRQLWWGHRIPAFFVTFNDSSATPKMAEEDFWIVARNLEEATALAVAKFNVSKDAITLNQDEDVLDTWFSSGLFPFSVFGWPDNTNDMKLFYPGSLLETGNDILFFWVARMVFFGQTLLGKLPFKEVFLHPMVRDAHGRKMSKSLGNVIDPMDVILGISLEGLHLQLLDSNLDPKEIEKAKAGQKQDYPNGIPECGVDAMRFALCSYLTQARDINLDIMRVQGYRFFCNKLWNATKFALMYFNPNEKYDVLTTLTSNESNVDLWILSRLAHTIDTCNKAFATYEFAQATNACYSFWLYDLCDNYLECLKPIFASDDELKKSTARKVLYTCLDLGLRLLSPFMPFISEELFQRLPRNNLDIPSICVAPYPELEQFSFIDETIEKDFEFVQKVAKALRSARSDYNILVKVKTEAYVLCQDDNMKNVLEKFNSELKTMSYCSLVDVVPEAPKGCAILAINSQCEIHLMLAGVIEADKEIGKLQKKKDQLEQTITKLNQKMSIDDYQKKVPANIQEENTETLKQSAIEIERIASAIQALKIM